VHVLVAPLHESSEPPQGFGVRQSSGALERVNAIESGTGVPHSRTQARTEGSGHSLDLRWLLKKLGSENVTSLLVEGGGETNASFLFNGLVQRVMFFYAPKIMGGRDSRKGVASEGVTKLSDAIQLHDVEWKKVAGDLMMTARTDRTPQR
jgi:riboflavin biosynthesis pyrimidine reductase